MTTPMAAGSPREFIQKTNGKSTKGKERQPKEKSYSRSKKILEEKKGKALRKKINLLRLEHDRHAKSLTRDLMEIKECLTTLHADKEMRRDERMEGIKEKKIAEDLKSIKELTDDDQVADQKSIRQYNVIIDDTKHAFLQNMSGGNATNGETSLTRKEKNINRNIVAIHLQRSKLSPRSGKNMALKKEVVLSVSNTHGGGAKQESEVEKIAKLNIETNFDHKIRTRSKCTKSAPDENEASFTKRKEKAASEDSQKLYRTSKVTRVGLVGNGLHSDDHRKDASSSAMSWYPGQSSSSASFSSLHPSKRRAVLPPLDFRRMESTSKLH